MFASRLVLTAIGVLALAALPMRADEEKGPHGGVLFEGAKHKYHIELKVDADGKTMTAYILDNKAKKAVPIKAKTIELKIKGVESPITLTGVEQKDKPDSFIEYRAKNDRFGEKIDFAKVQVVAKILEDKPAITFVPDTD